MDKNKELLLTLQSGGVAVIPTDTIYGIVGKALNEKTVARIYDIKERAPEKPFIILISDIDMLSDFGIKLSAFEKNYLGKVWPGPVSVILECKDKKLWYLHRGTGSLAFRMPLKKELRTLIASCGPLVAPSANPEGEIPAANVAEAKKYFENKIDSYYDGGKIVSNPSKLVLLKDGEEIVLRK